MEWYGSIIGYHQPRKKGFIGLKDCKIGNLTTITNKGLLSKN